MTEMTEADHIEALQARVKELEGERDANARDGYQCGQKLADAEARAETAEAAVSRLTTELERARGALVAHNDYLRTSYQVAKRHGINTDWNLLAAALLRVLTDHHQTSNAARWPDIYDEAARDFLAREGKDDA